MRQSHAQEPDSLNLSPLRGQLARREIFMGRLLRSVAYAVAERPETKTRQVGREHSPRGTDPMVLKRGFVF